MDPAVVFPHLSAGVGLAHCSRGIMATMTLASGGSIFPGEGGATDKAQRFFDRGRDVADACNFDYAIELFIHALSLVPDHVPAHKELRLIALERKARGGQDIGNFDKLKQLRVDQMLRRAGPPAKPRTGRGMVRATGG